MDPVWSSSWEGQGLHHRWLRCHRGGKENVLSVFRWNQVLSTHFQIVLRLQRRHPLNQSLQWHSHTGEIFTKLLPTPINCNGQDHRADNSPCCTSCDMPRWPWKQNHKHEGHCLIQVAIPHGAGVVVNGPMAQAQHAPHSDAAICTVQVLCVGVLGQLYSQPVLPGHRRLWEPPRRFTHQHREALVGHVGTNDWRFTNGSYS